MKTAIPVAVLVSLGAAAACHSEGAKPAAPSTSKAAVEPVVTPAKRLAAALGRQDTAEVFDALLAAATQAGIRHSNLLNLETEGPEKPLSFYSPDTALITVTRLLGPGEGRAYWSMWSELLTGGAWKPDAIFADEAEMLRLGNYAIMGILAHEIGHHLLKMYHATPNGDGWRELYADKVAVAFLNHLAEQDADLRALRDRYREVVAGSLLDRTKKTAQPILEDGDGDKRFASHGLPKDPAAYVALQLTRQRMLLDETGLHSLESLARTVLRSGEGGFLATRRDDPTLTATIETTRTLEKEVPKGALVAVSPDGRVVIVRNAGKGKAFFVQEAGKPEIRIPFPPMEKGAYGPGAVGVAVVGDRLFVSTAMPPGVVAVEGNSAKVLVPPSQFDDYENPMLGADAQGQLYVLDNDKGVRIRRVDLATGELTPVASFVKNKRNRQRYGDGSVEVATIAIRSFALHSDGRVLFVDHKRSALRSVHRDEVATLAGGWRGYRDGSGFKAELAAPQALAPARGGGYWIVDQRMVAAGEKFGMAAYLRRARLR